MQRPGGDSCGNGSVRRQTKEQVKAMVVALGSLEAKVVMEAKVFRGHAMRAANGVTVPTSVHDLPGGELQVSKEERVLARQEESLVDGPEEQDKKDGAAEKEYMACGKMEQMGGLEQEMAEPKHCPFSIYRNRESP